VRLPDAEARVKGHPHAQNLVVFACYVGCVVAFAAGKLAWSWWTAV